jgi:8-oxo-dGTP diphosphatase
MQNTDLKSVRVSAGILIKNNKILLTQRLKTQPYPYFWEFPGGKKKDRESYFSCLKRELHEEIGINVKDAKKWIQRQYVRDGINIKIIFYIVHSWSGKISAKEVNDYRWIDPKTNDSILKKILPKNKYLLKALRLPPFYLISNFDELRYKIKKINLSEKVFLQIREKELKKHDVEFIYESLRDKDKLTLIQNFDNKTQLKNVKNIHLPSKYLKKEAIKKIKNKYKLIGASVHNLKELRLAESLGVDYILVGPVLKTKSHDKAKPIGWSKFNEIANESDTPVYALGGMCFEHLASALRNGAVGISSKSKLWDYWT